MIMIRVLCLEQKGQVVYDPNLHRGRLHKFLYFESARQGAEEQTIICADQQVLTHKELFERAKGLGFELSLDELKGAGACIGGRIYPMMGWSSIGFDIETPDELKLIIIEALALSQ